jgi:hypothetical protein
MRIAKAYDPTWSFEAVPTERVAKLPPDVVRLLDRFTRELVAAEVRAGGEPIAPVWRLVRDAKDRSTWVIVGDVRASFVVLVSTSAEWERWKYRSPQRGWAVLADLFRARPAAPRCRASDSRA